MIKKITVDIDTDMLRDQRNDLLDIIQDVYGDQKDSVDGLINLCDALLDSLEGFKHA